MLPIINLRTYIKESNLVLVSIYNYLFFILRTQICQLEKSIFKLTLLM
jgi:hypothetical protein